MPPQKLAQSLSSLSGCPDYGVHRPIKSALLSVLARTSLNRFARALGPVTQVIGSQALFGRHAESGSG